MKIIKEPKFKPIKCHCGCEFEHEIGDAVEVKTLYGYKTIVRLCYVRCPVCGSKNALTKELDKEQDIAEEE